jgi:hypothetical protein
MITAELVRHVAGDSDIDAPPPGSDEDNPGGTDSGPPGKV